MNIQIIELKKLKRAEYNPRKELTPEDEEYQKLKKSIVEFGYVVPVVINQDYTVIGGHQGLTVLEDLGYEKIECNVLNLTKIQEKALNLALNKIDGIWDYNKLENVLTELKESDFDLDVTGFDFDEVIKRRNCRTNKSIGRNKRTYHKIRGHLDFRKAQIIMWR